MWMLLLHIHGASQHHLGNKHSETACLGTSSLADLLYTFCVPPHFLFVIHWLQPWVSAVLIYFKHSSLVLCVSVHWTVSTTGPRTMGQDTWVHSKHVWWIVWRQVRCHPTFVQLFHCYSRKGWGWLQQPWVNQHCITIFFLLSDLNDAC